MCDEFLIETPDGEIQGISCSRKPKDHTCNDLGSVYETYDGERHFFSDEEKAKEWYEENYREVGMWSCACSICERAEFDNSMMGFALP